jgi:type I restriction enzyme, R subunit
VPDYPSYREELISQIPALQFLQNLGYTYLRPTEIAVERGGRLSNVILEKTLETQLRRINKITFRKQEHAFSEANIKAAIDKLKDAASFVTSEGLVRTSERIYDLLSLARVLNKRLTVTKKAFRSATSIGKNLRRTSFTSPRNLR